MVSWTSLSAALAAFAMSAENVRAHGYMDKPLAAFKDKETSAWVVEIAPQWKGDWDSAKGDEGLVALYKQLKKSNNVKDIRTVLDSDTKLYGEDCGFTDPKATPQSPPTTGDATFSRGMVHAGPCEIWLDDKMVLQSDDCRSAYGDGMKEKASVFKPVDYSSCASGGCMFRFYWLALQRRDSKTYWQVYKNCIPLSGPAGGGASQTTSSSGDGSSTSQTSPSSGESESPSSGESSSPSSVQGLGLGTNSTSSTSTTASSTTTDSSSTQEHSLSSNSGTIKKTKTPSTDVPEATTATSKFGSENGPTRSPSSKCNARERH
ncbi:hypothetical protein PF005_g26756 [Phytophthora fragariae]|uniref:Uncharacterized protein n=1 Tax=Phytophthora fragariae TaxID=53985 RepID=A0A6A4BPP8_9STRA|nr:hypothetical protein PF009_g27433 [Phytophthora fragariae]KAE9172329.1 hypothetical protein PF005_g26756 [Phytophthora fragariae]KAE9276456.1 hypothetical protein PF001_g26119 [Phytophthora fragariae]